jgi:hypothetical protein
MQYSLFVKTDFGVPSCTIDFIYEEKEKIFRNIKITNLAADIEYRVDNYFPVVGMMKVQAIDLFNTGVDDDYASDILIRIPEPNKINCQQAFDCIGMFWNLQTIENNGTYELTEYNK